MKTHTPHLIRLATLALTTFSLSPVALSAKDLGEQIVGMWLPVSQYVDQEGRKLEPFGSDPKGIVIYDDSGRFVLMLQRATLPRFASNNRLAGTPEENKAIVQGSIAYFGKYTWTRRRGS
ncbi:MAG TPA: lipocalin-like domain-containing protein [Burkholderiaceae bacterium]|nr:lipocalin-like domain-containing protein [Burkholderiaceae bacterium]